VAGAGAGAVVVVAVDAGGSATAPGNSGDEMTENEAAAVKAYDKHRAQVIAEIEATYPGHAEWLLVDYIDAETKRRAKAELNGWKGK
jgi:hypothetical protein